MLLILTVASFFILGRELTMRLWRSSTSPLSRSEVLVAAFSIGFTLWLGTLWIAALTGILTAPVLAARNLVVAVAAALLWFQRWRERRAQLAFRWPSATTLAVAAPLLLWAAFVLWRGWVVPPLSHDAVAYHLPKAALYARAGAYDPLPELPARARNIPVNYELLLADTLILEGNDRRSEWLSLVHYLFFIAAAAALAQRWWGDERGVAVTALFVAAVPVALLHSGAHKNDLMTAAFMTASLVWLGRFLSIGEFRSLVAGAATLAMGAGTKPQAAILAVAAMPFVIARLAKGDRFLRRLVSIAGCSIVFTLLLGGAYWIADRTQRPQSDPAPRAAAVPVTYGDWENLWQVPYVLISAPFSRSPMALSIPWSEQPWFWRRYEIYFSELGISFAICALVLPLAVIRYRNDVGERRNERLAVSVIAAATFAVMLPVVFRPHGFYAISAPRYVLFIAPTVFAWTVAPYVRSRPSAVARWIVAGGAIAIFATYAVLNARRDLFAPIDYVRWAAANRGTRVIPFDPNRAPSIVDRAAAPDEAVAIEAAEGTWLYPVFGSDLSRPVQLLAAGRPASIHPAVRWVVIDRKFLTVWRHPAFENLSQTRQFITRGATNLTGVGLFRALVSDPEWQLFHVEEEAGQAIFRRKASRAVHE